MRFKSPCFFLALPEKRLIHTPEHFSSGRHTIYMRRKQLVSVLMLALFLFIQGLKLDHTHGHDSAENIKGKKELISTDNHCEICDYHFSAGFTMQNSQPISCVVQDIPCYFNFYQSASINSIGLSYSDRGPPALI